MRRLLLLCVLLMTISINAQISSLSNLASGKMVVFSPIFEKNKNIYGYFTLFKLDELSENEEKYEYVILDKNLNEVANGEFIDASYKGIYARYYGPDKAGENLILTKYYGNITETIAFASSRILNLNNNTIQEPVYFQEKSLHRGNRPIDNLKKRERKIKFLEVPISLNNGYLVIDIKKKFVKENPTNICFYNLKHDKIWEYHFGDNRKSEYNIESFDDDFVYASYRTDDYKNTNVKFLQIDSNSGKLKYSYLLEDINSKYNYNYTVKRINNRTILTGKISPYRVVSGYDYNNVVGLFKIVLDENGKELFKKYFLWKEASEFIEMNKRGRLDAGYKLFVQSYFIFKDERIVVLSEKFKKGENLLAGGMVKTTDFVLLEFDGDFDLKAAETIKKDLSRFTSSDFLFAQYLNDENDAVFFYQDYQKDLETKEKEWILGIVSIVNGEVSHEKIPMSADDFFISPYIAKEGSILLREYNKNSEFDKIRLERLNLN